MLAEKHSEVREPSDKDPGAVDVNACELAQSQERPGLGKGVEERGRNIKIQKRIYIYTHFIFIS